METLSGIWAYVLVALGLSLVVFIHELGHFLVAKRAGVKVETFSIGFGPVLFGIKRGETRYVISAFPLGGYVLMLGMDEEGASAEKSTDPRAFQNKSVGARMAIMSAGVIMNVILGLACFVVAYKMGMNYMPAIVGGVVPGSPAYEAGVKVGERIVSINGRETTSFRDLIAASAETDKKERLRLELEEPNSKTRRVLTIEPRAEKRDMFPMIGVTPARGLSLAVDDDSTRMPGLENAIEGIREGDRIVAVGLEGTKLEPVRSFTDYQRIAATHRAEVLALEVERKTASGKIERATLKLPPNHVVGFGLRMTIGPIASIRGDSPAAKAGFKVGDRIVAVEGNRDFDPALLPLDCRDRAGLPTRFEVERLGDDGKTKTTVELIATPDAAFPWNHLSETLLDVGGLGVCYPIEPRIAGVEPNSPAAKAGLKVGEVVAAITLSPPKDAKGVPIKSALKSKSIELAAAPGASASAKDDAESANWTTIFFGLQGYPIDRAVLKIQGRKAPVELVAERSPDRFNAIRGLMIADPLTMPLPPQSVPAAIRRGLQDTRDSIASIFYNLRGLVTGRISRKSMASVIRIVPAIRDSVNDGFSAFVHMLGLLSINLAVINFLPIPPLDGGRLVFLFGEKVRGRPLPDSLVHGFQFAGMVFVLGLMAFVLFQDIKITIWD